MRWRLLLILVAVAALVAPLPPSLVERLYSGAVFPLIQQALTSASNLVSLALFDLFLGASVLVLVGLTVRDIIRDLSWGRRGARLVVRLLTTAAAVYIAFLLVWGFNYRRVPLRDKLPFAGERVSRDAAMALARETVEHLNVLHAQAHAAGWLPVGEVDRPLAGALDAAVRSVGGPHAPVPARPKQTVLDLYFRRTGVAGMTDPFFLETLVTSALLPFERSFVVAHEWAHLAGFTDEGEANFVGWLTCLRGSVPHQYSGWLFLYGEVLDALPREVRADVSATLAAGPRADLEAIRERLVREVNPTVSAAGWQVYDQYLKANRVDAGTASYAEVVQLILGTGVR